MKRRGKADEIYDVLEDLSQDEAGDQVFYPDSGSDRDRIFRQAEAPRDYNAIQKLWNKARKKVCAPGLTASECLRLHRDEVMLRLKQAGFYKITALPCPDLTYRKREQLGMTLSVSIAGEEDFKRATEFPFDAPVEIRYHVFKKVPVGFTPQALRKGNVCDTAAYFRHQGFGIVRSIPIHDLKMGWLKIDGQVEQVLIDGFDRFRPDSLFPVNTEILIYYHTFKR